MKKQILRLIFLLTILFIPVKSYSQNLWFALQQPQIGSGVAVKSSGTVQSLLTPSSFYKRNDTNSSWEKIYSDLNQLFHDFYFHNNDSIYIATSGSGILFSSNGGNTWASRNAGLTNLSIQEIYFNNDVLIACTRGGIFTSSNFGLSWNFHSFPNQTVDKIYIDSRGIWYVIAYETVRASYDGGFTWVNLDGSSHSIYENSIGELVRIGESKIFKSVDGIIWNNIFTLQNNNKIYSAILFSDSLIIVSTNSKTLFRINFSGNVIDSSYYIHPTLNLSAYLTLIGLNSSSQIIYANSKYGILSSTDAGITWTFDQKGLTEIIVQYIRETNDHIILHCGLLTYRSFKNYYNFELIANLPYAHRTKNFLSIDNKLYMMIDTAVFISLDQGTNWNVLYYDQYYRDGYFTTWAKGSKIALGLVGRIMFSTDSGINWLEKRFPFTASPNVYAIVELPDKFFLIATSEAIWKCDSSFSNMELKTHISHRQLLLTKSDLVVGIDKISGITYSSDFGVTWNNTAQSVPYINCMVENDSNEIFLGTNNGIFFSKFPFNYWEEFSVGLLDKKVLSIYSDSIGHLLAGTGSSGLFRTLHSTTNLKEDNKFQPVDFLLHQNYPNPFNPSTKIKFTVPPLTPSLSRGERVMLKVFDILGREVATLVNEELSAGEYEVEFNTTDKLRTMNYQLSTNIYFYQLRVGGLVETKKMVYLK